MLSTANISIGLVNYKSPEVTSVCLELLKKAIDVSTIPIWVIDNDSGDESLEYLKSLDWIRLIERKPVAGEAGFIAHGAGLDMILERVGTPYLLILHTDTFIYDPAIIQTMLNICEADAGVAAVGCLEPIWRSRPHLMWRYVTRGVKYYFRKMKIKIGLPSRWPKLHYETYLKSFCALWNVNIIRKHDLHFNMENRIPGYAMQDRLSQLGCKIIAIPPREMFSGLDHIEKATASTQGGVRINFRTAGKYQEKLKRARNA
ncbi:MAG: hypothetical protein LBE62_02550 [Azonexus sp.]|jgi:GT2 family glycosyltransferase|nr:hypothetical protein [Azonexus sp.]